MKDGFTGNCCHSRMLLEKKGEQPRTKSYDNFNVRLSLHKMCQLILNRVFSNHDYILCCISSLITQHLALSTDCLFLKANTSSLTILKQPLTKLQLQLENKSFFLQNKILKCGIIKSWISNVVHHPYIKSLDSREVKTA